MTAKETNPTNKEFAQVVNLIRKAKPSDMHDLMEDLHYVLRDSPARKTPTKTAPPAPWRPPQDYYCTTLYKHKLTRKPNI